MEEADHFRFSRPTAVVISWRLFVTKDGGAVPVASNCGMASQFLVPRVTGNSGIPFGPK